MSEWIKANEGVLIVLVAASVVTFVVTLIAVPIVVARLPADYFADERRRRTRWADQHPVLRMLMQIGLNMLGTLFVLAGLAMLVLPGQGILTMVIGVMLLRFPGKYRLERWFAARRPVRRAIDWLRRKAGRAPMIYRDLESPAPPGEE